MRTLHHEEVKILLGDNLVAHLSPYVLRMCEEYNIRYIFLPENSTHLLQPLDVAVFSPMKREWRRILADWKEESSQHNQVYATIPKSVFLSLLKKLLEKDYSGSVRIGFESFGLIPFSLQKALSKLPQEEREVESNMQQQLLNKLNNMRYSQPAPAQAPHPRKDRLPAGASYTCLPGQQDEVCMPGECEEEMMVEVLDRSLAQPGNSRKEDSDSESEAELILHASNSTGKRARREFWGAENEEVTDEEDNEKESVEDSEEDSGEDTVEGEKVDDPEECQYPYYPAGSYVVAVYQGAWYVGLVLEKKNEKQALPQEEYLFMQRLEKSGDLFKWPDKQDKLNTLREDVLFACGAPAPASATSSSRSISFSLSKAEIKKAYMLLNKAFYHTKLILTFFYGTFIIKMGQLGVCL